MHSKGHAVLDDEVVFELLLLSTKGSTKATNPEVLKVLQDVRSQIGTKSRFFHCIENTSWIFILGQWKSLQDHKDFVKSPRGKEILGPQEELLKFEWVKHFQAPRCKPAKNMASIPAKPVLQFTRLTFENHHDKELASEYFKLFGNYDYAFERMSEPDKSLLKLESGLEGWQCDPTPDGEDVTHKEYILLTGYHEVPDEDRRESMTEKYKDSLARIYEDLQTEGADCFSDAHVVHMVDLEKTGAYVWT